MRLSDLLVRALTPHAEELSTWTKNDFEMLFLGFGNLRVFTPARIEFSQTFYNNALDIGLALDEMGFGDMDFFVQKKSLPYNPLSKERWQFGRGL